MRLVPWSRLALLASLAAPTFAAAQPAAPDDSLRAAFVRLLTHRDTVVRVDSVPYPVPYPVPYAVHDTTVVTKLRVDSVPYPVHDTVFVAAAAAPVLVPMPPVAPPTAPAPAPIPAPAPPPASAALYLATRPAYLAKVRQAFEDTWTADSATWNGNAQKIHGGGGNYYDRAASYYQFAAMPEFADVAATYVQRAVLGVIDYRDKYVLANQCGPSPHWSLMEGLYRHALATGDTVSANAVQCVASRLRAFLTSSYTDSTGGESRILGRIGLMNTYARLLAEQRGDSVKAKAFRAAEDAALARVVAWQRADGSFPAVQQVCDGQLNYMTAIQASWLIEMAASRPEHRATVLSVVLKTAQFWKTQLRADGSLNYASVACPANAQGLGVGGPTAAPDLDMDFVWALAWLGQQTGDAQWTALADALFADGTARGYWYGGKQANELLQFGARYLAIRGLP